MGPRLSGSDEISPQLLAAPGWFHIFLFCVEPERDRERERERETGALGKRLCIDKQCRLNESEALSQHSVHVHCLRSDLIPAAWLGHASLSDRL